MEISKKKPEDTESRNKTGWRITIPVSVLISLIVIACLYIFVPAVQIFILSFQLDWTSSPEEATQIVNELFEYDSDYARRMVREYVEQSPRRAADTDYPANVHLDSQTGDIYTAPIGGFHQKGNESESRGTGLTLDDILTVEDIGLNVNSVIINIGDPPKTFDVIVQAPERLSSEDGIVKFIAKDLSKNEYGCLEFVDRYGTSTCSVSEEEKTYIDRKFE